MCRLFELCYLCNLAFSVAKHGHHGLHIPMSASSLEVAAHDCVVEMFQLHKNGMESLSSMASACTKAKKGISLFSNAVSRDSFTVMAVTQKPCPRIKDTKTNGRHTWICNGTVQPDQCQIDACTHTCPL